MKIYHSGADNHFNVVPETVLKAGAMIMLTYGGLRRLAAGNSRFKRLCRWRRKAAKC